MRVGKATLFSVLIACALAPAWLQDAWAWGAVAVGSSDDLANDGFAFGAAFNEQTEEAATKAALQVCQGFSGAPSMAKKCKVVRTFHGECYSLAFDPQPGMAGMGWAIAADQASAEQQAEAECKKTAGPNRQKFCKLAQTHCDRHD